MTDRDAVIRKFSGLHKPTGKTRRFDYKGERWRLNLRLGEDLTVSLRMIKLITGEDKNSYCERVLAEAIRLHLDNLKSKHDQSAWQTLEAVATRRQR